MRISTEWLKEFTPIPEDPAETARTLTMAGLEVEETETSSIGPVLNVTVTPNRGDCLSVLGLARELSAARGTPLKSPVLPTAGESGQCASEASIRIENPELCRRYAARIIRHVRHVDSPKWMQDRLLAAGMRPIGGMVDVTNYVMLELGQPLHAFDLDRLAGKRIVVRSAHPGEKLTTLDGTERSLTPEILCICDAERPIALAGVMGGADTEVSDSTTTVLLESASFHPRAVRRTARELGMRTEASFRFERTVDPNLVVAAAERACTLITELGMGEVVPGVLDLYPNPPATHYIGVRPQRVRMLLGYPITDARCREMLERLGFTVDTRPEALHVTVPSWRPDCVREENLAEEIGRVDGYQHIPESLPKGTTLQGADNPVALFCDDLREILCGAGLQEIVGHSLLAPTPLDGPEDGTRIAIRSALSADLSGLRRSLLPGLVDALDRNARRGCAPLAFFEVARVFRGQEGKYHETLSAGGVLSGPLSAGGWRREDRPIDADFFTAKGLVETLLRCSGIAEFQFIPSHDARFHPHRSADILLSGQRAGVIGELHPGLTADIHVRGRVVAFELSVESMLANRRHGSTFAAPSTFPAVVRDLAPRVSLQTPYAHLAEAVAAVPCPALEEVQLVDRFSGAPLPEGTQSLTLRFTFRAHDHTLTEQEVSEALAQVRASLEQRCAAKFPA
jgi:phenylalanyl-tRNA synthetase beta chain